MFRSVDLDSELLGLVPRASNYRAKSLQACHSSELGTRASCFGWSDSSFLDVTLPTVDPCLMSLLEDQYHSHYVIDRFYPSGLPLAPKP